MKVLLANPPWQDAEHPELWGVRAGSRWPHFQKRAGDGKLPRYIPFPFFLGIAASLLQDAGHEVRLIDGVAEGFDTDIFCKRVTDFKPDIIFVETSTPSLKYDLEVLQKLYDSNPDVIVIFGGSHDASQVADLLATENVIQYWITGEYEEALLNLTTALSDGKDPRTIEGVITNGQPVGVPASIKDLDRLPAPLFSQLPIAHYSDPVCGLPSPTANAWLSRGCPFGCTFCVWPQVIYGNRNYRTRSIDRALDEVQLLIDTYGCESFYFDDDTTNIGADRMRELAEKIKQRQLDQYPWSMMARADCMTDAMIDELAAAGMYSVKYGVESISPQLLDACEKGTNLEKMKRAIAHTQAAGIKIHLTFTFGLPGETLETIKETLDYCMSVEPETAQFSLCTPFPGTEFYEQCRNNDWLTTEDWGKYLGSEEAVVSTPWLTANELAEGYKAALDTWNGFVNDRLDARKNRLIANVQSALAEGKKLIFIGDRDFSKYLLDHTSIDRSHFTWMSSASIQSLEQDVIPVILSRNNEEKIWRKLKQIDPDAAIKSLRLYS